MQLPVIFLFILFFSFCARAAVCAELVSVLKTCGGRYRDEALHYGGRVQQLIRRQLQEQPDTVRHTA